MPYNILDKSIMLCIMLMQYTWKVMCILYDNLLSSSKQHLMPKLAMQLDVAYSLVAFVSRTTQTFMFTLKELVRAKYPSTSSAQVSFLVAVLLVPCRVLLTSVKNKIQEVLIQSTQLTDWWEWFLYTWGYIFVIRTLDFIFSNKADFSFHHTTHKIYISTLLCV